MLFLEGVYVDHPDDSLDFRWVKAPSSAELSGITQTVARRIGRLAAMVPKPRVKLTRFHGVPAPNIKHRVLAKSTD